jgi:hypothetical protein
MLAALQAACLKLLLVACSTKRPMAGAQQSCCPDCMACISQTRQQHRYKHQAREAEKCFQPESFNLH